MKERVAFSQELVQFHFLRFFFLGDLVAAAFARRVGGSVGDKIGEQVGSSGLLLTAVARAGQWNRCAACKKSHRNCVWIALCKLASVP